MFKKTLSDEVLQHTVNVCANSESRTEAARTLNLAESTVRRHLEIAAARGIVPRTDSEGEIQLPNFPDDDIDAEQIVDMMERRFLQRHKHHQAHRWFPIRFKSDAPIGLVVVGDPHLGSNGCNFPLIRQHARLLAAAEGCYAVNIGDTVDNWGGKLVRLYAENDVSRATERKLARWFLQETGIPWIVWLHGNHDTMADGFSTYLNAINAKTIPMVDWRARFRLVFPSSEVKVDAAHNHKGHSMWNALHGQIRAAHMDEFAHIVVAGHHHTWALGQVEMPSGDVVHLGRARGYKFIDDHAHRHGFAEQQYGAAIMYVIRPSHHHNPIKFIRSFADIEDGCDYLAIVREKDGRAKAA